MKDSRVVDDVTRAAVELFAQNGYANTTVQQIVQNAGVTKGALYHYFESKDDLLFGIYERLLNLQKAHLDDIISRVGPVDDLLRAACVDVVETSIDHMAEVSVFFRSLNMLSHARQREVTSRRRAYHDKFAQLVILGQSEGLYRTDIPLTILVAHFFSDVHYLFHWYSSEGPESKTLVAEQLADLFLDSLRTLHSGT